MSGQWVTYRDAILALDLGTTTGWAGVHAGGGTVQSGSISFKGGRFEGGGMRYLRFRRWLDEVFALLQFKEVVFEEVRRHMGVDAAHAYGGFMGTLTSWCEEKGIPYQGVPVGTIKAHATGKGNANKEAMIKAALERGHDPKDDNEADAIALAYLAMER